MMSDLDNLALDKYRSKYGVHKTLADVKVDGGVDAWAQWAGEKKAPGKGAISFFIRSNGATKASLRLLPDTRIRSVLQEVLSKLDASAERDFYLALSGKPIDPDVTVGTIIPCSTLDLRVRFKF